MTTHNVHPLLVVGTFDTKGRELDFVARRITDAGARVITVDVSTAAEGCSADVAAATVAACHPQGAVAVLQDDRGRAIAEMAVALKIFLLRYGPLAGVIGLGGSGGTALLSVGFRALPIGLPKLIVSTVASGDVAPYIDASDLILMPAITDVAGLNPISRTIFAQAADAIVAMARSKSESNSASARHAIGLTMFGVTTSCVEAVSRALEQDHDCLVFHATGVGGRTMEKLVDSALIQGVIDLSTTEVADRIVGGTMAATDDRFGAIARTRVPWVGSVGACDMVNFGARSTVPERHVERLFYQHNPQVTLMRTTPAENHAIGTWIATRLNDCAGEIRLILPRGGISAIDAPGMPFHDPAADEALFDAIAATLHETESRRLITSTCHINDPAFAALVVETFRSIRVMTR